MLKPYVSLSLLNFVSITKCKLVLEAKRGGIISHQVIQYNKYFYHLWKIGGGDSLMKMH